MRLFRWPGNEGVAWKSESGNSQRGLKRKVVNLSGKIAVVTGGTRGIGFAIAQALVDSGANIFICARDAGEIADAVKRLNEKGKVAGVECNVRDESSVTSMLADCERLFGGIDILVNNAGV